MAGFQLLTTGELEAARVRWRERTPDGAAARLHENAELAVSDPRYESPLELGLASNLFQVQGLLLEASLAFACSGEERYLQPVERCLRGIADERMRKARLPNEVHRAFAVVGLAVAHELCGEAIDRALLRDTVASITAELHHAAGHEEWGDEVLKRNAWNHTAVAYAAIGCGGLLCAEHDPRARGWLEDALGRVRLFFADGVTDAGMTREGLAYCGFAFRNLAPLLLAARNAGVWDYRSPEENSHLERLRKVPRWYAIETLPGGRWLQPINDSYWSPKRAMGGFLSTFGALDPSLTAWVYDMLLGARGDGSHGQDRGMATSSLFESVLWEPAQVPTDVQASLPELLVDPVVGYVAERVRQRPWSGFSLNCGEFIGGIHDQSDNGSVTLFAGTVPLLIDSGAANDPVDGSPSSSHGHNVVLIDGRGQLPSGGGAGCTGTILHAERSRAATVVSADMTASYCARAYNPVAHALRHCVYGKHPFTYLLLVDDFARPNGEQAAFDQLFHTPAAGARERVGDGVRLHIEFAGKARGLELRPLDNGADILEETFTQHDKALFDPHSLWRIRRKREGCVLMPTLALPYREGHAPEVAGEFDAAAGRVTLRWRVDGDEGVDVLSFTPGVATAATFTRDGQAPKDAEPLMEARPTAARGGSRVATGVAAAVTRLRSAAGGASDALDERALRRRRRLRRLVDGIEAFEAEGEPALAGTGALAGMGGDGAESERRLGRELLEQLVSFADLDPDDSVLELGCGMGHLAAALLHYLRYGSYTGLDPSAESVAWCQEQLTPRNPRFTFARWDPAQALPCKDESLDFVLATSCTPELARVLRVGGAVFLTTTLDGGDAVERVAGVARLTVDRTARGAFAGLHSQPDIVVLRRGR
ncbi:MAG TPA: methyltransferase domain-containing protein [Solirubrobacteraceae bacterium]|jgi:SAM-dependent methyltransferase